jgi:transcriptional regulator of acetoin/glycerol metabolism
VGKNREEAAQRLGISRATLFRLLKKHNLINYQGKP